MKLVAALCSGLVACAVAASLARSPRQSAPAAVAPFKIAGNIYYVGTSDPTAFLLTTGAGHILIDTTYEQTAPLVAESIRTLGFKLEDVKIILSSHSHLDHVGGHASMKRLTGAQVVASAADAVNLESGGAKAFHQTGTYAPVTVDRKLNDGDTVKIGDVTLTALVVPGHTEGNTAWTTTVTDGGRTYTVLFAPSMSINPGVKMVNNPTWPGVGAAYAAAFKRLRAMKYDIFLGPHAGFFDLQAKRQRLQSGANPFVDPQGYQQFLDGWEAKYDEQLRREKQGG
jgi:metallo-beta-lactamase class B